MTGENLTLLDTDIKGKFTYKLSYNVFLVHLLYFSLSFLSAEYSDPHPHPNSSSYHSFHFHYPLFLFLLTSFNHISPFSYLSLSFPKSVFFFSPVSSSTPSLSRSVLHHEDPLLCNLWGNDEPSQWIDTMMDTISLCEFLAFRQEMIAVNK
jgi:hypothetical protein